MGISAEASNRLYAAGWRYEIAPFFGPRVMKDYGDTGVYATIVSQVGRGGIGRVYTWAVWSWGSGQYLAGGQTSDDAELAAARADSWAEEE